MSIRILVFLSLLIGQLDTTLSQEPDLSVIADPQASSLPLYQAFVGEYKSSRDVVSNWDSTTPTIARILIFYQVALKIMNAGGQSIMPLPRFLVAMDRAWSSQIPHTVDRREFLAVLAAFHAFDLLESRARFLVASHDELKDSVSELITKHKDRIWVTPERLSPWIKHWREALSPWHWPTQALEGFSKVWPQSDLVEIVKSRLLAQWIWPTDLPAKGRDESIQKFLVGRLSVDPQGFVNQMRPYFVNGKMRNADERALKRVHADLFALVAEGLERWPAQVAEQKRQQEQAELQKLESSDYLRQLLESALTAVFGPSYLKMHYGQKTLARLLTAVEDGTLKNPAALYDRSEPHAWLLSLIQDYLRHNNLPVSSEITQQARAEILAIRLKHQPEIPRVTTKIPLDRCRESLRKF